MRIDKHLSKVLGLVLLLSVFCTKGNADQAYVRRDWTWLGLGGRYGLVELELVSGLGQDATLPYVPPRSNWETEILVASGKIVLPHRPVVLSAIACAAMAGLFALVVVSRKLLTRSGQLSQLQRKEGIA